MREIRKKREKRKRRERPDSTALQNYMAIVAIVPAVVSVLAYELVDYLLYRFWPERIIYYPINGIAMLVPMALMMELFTYFFSKNLLKKTTRLTDAIHQVADGNFDVVLSEEHAAPYKEVYHNFNRMTKELSGVQTMRTDFINNFSHEFKTPISSIHGFARLLLDTQVSEEERREYLQIIAEESERLTHLAEETMFLSKLDSQQIIEGKERYALDRQIRQMIILLQTFWEEKEITFEMELPKLRYYGNVELMSHIWMNILNNAIKFTPEQGKIFVDGKEEGGIIAIRIRDTGIGMTEEEMGQVFHRYYQADTSHSGKGLGLGLSIADRIVDKNTRRLTMARLAPYYQVVPAKDGEEALSVFFSRHIDLVVADVMMPGMDGYELVRTLRGYKKEVPVILLTAKSAFLDKKEGFRSGTDDYMTKPVDYEELLWRIEALLRRAHINADKKITVGNSVLDETSYTLVNEAEHREIVFPKKEFDILFKLLSYPDQIFAKETLLEEIWGMDTDCDDSTIKTHMNRLRNKLKDVTDFEIVTIRGLGYKARILH